MKEETLSYLHAVAPRVEATPEVYRLAASTGSRWRVVGTQSRQELRLAGVGVKVYKHRDAFASAVGWTPPGRASSARRVIAGVAKSFVVAIWVWERRGAVGAVGKNVQLPRPDADSRHLCGRELKVEEFRPLALSLQATFITVFSCEQFPK